MTLDEREKNYQTKPISHNPQGINGLWLVSSAAGRPARQNPNGRSAGIQGDRCPRAVGPRGNRATTDHRSRGATGQQNYQTKPIPSNCHRNNNLYDALERQTAERNHLANSKRLSLPTASTAPFRANRERIRAANARVCKKTGDCPKRRARAWRFINDLREARGLYPGVFHGPTSERQGRYGYFACRWPVQALFVALAGNDLRPFSEPRASASGPLMSCGTRGPTSEKWRSDLNLSSSFLIEWY